MARKKKTRTASSAGETRKRRKRRTSAEMIADLEAEIARVRARQVARDLKRSPAFKASLSAIKSIDKALADAADEGHTALRHALADARKALGGFLEDQGMRLPKANLPKGPRPRSTK